MTELATTVPRDEWERKHALVESDAGQAAYIQLVMDTKAHMLDPNQEPPSTKAFEEMLLQQPITHRTDKTFNDLLEDKEINIVGLMQYSQLGNMVKDQVAKIFTGAAARINLTESELQQTFQLVKKKKPIKNQAGKKSNATVIEETLQSMLPKEHHAALKQGLEKSWVELAQTDPVTALVRTLPPTNEKRLVDTVKKEVNPAKLKSLMNRGLDISEKHRWHKHLGQTLDDIIDTANNHRDDILPPRKLEEYGIRKARELKIELHNKAIRGILQTMGATNKRSTLYTRSAKKRDELRSQFLNKHGIGRIRGWAAGDALLELAEMALPEAAANVDEEKLQETLDALHWKNPKTRRYGETIKRTEAIVTAAGYPPTENENDAEARQRIQGVIINAAREKMQHREAARSR